MRSQADDSAFGSVVICEAVLIGLWFGDHGNVSGNKEIVLMTGIAILRYSWNSKALADRSAFPRGDEPLLRGLGLHRR